MQFGIGNKPEDIKPEDLETLLNSLLDKKLGNFGSKASNIVKDMSSAKIQLSEACRRFDELDAEPNKLNIYIDNISFIKSQKNFYSKALRHIIDNWDLSSADAPNMHSRYSGILSNTEKFISEVLKSNVGFKKMLYSYSDHLDSFKRAFTYIERLRDSLVNELNRTGKEISEYNIVNEQVLELSLLAEKLSTINKSIEALNGFMASGNTGGINTEELEISKAISSRREELRVITIEAADIINKINSIAIPLERPARKFDHISSKKRQLHEFVMDPLNKIRDESDYRDFKALLEELIKSIDSQAIEVKNIEKTKESILDLINMNVYSILVSFKTLERKKSDLEVEIRHSEISLNKLKEDKYNSEKAIENIESLKSSLSDTRTKIYQTKDKVRGLFLEYYNKRILISDR